MIDLRPLVENDRVAHREDHDWRCGDGLVVSADDSGCIAYITWEGLDGVRGPYNREELIAVDDPDIDRTGDDDA